MRKVLIFLIKIYQYAISPYLGSSCRFTPTCSAYAKESIEVHGAWKGTILALKRIGRCHPFAPGGYDPVPEKNKTKSVS